MRSLFNYSLFFLAFVVILHCSQCQATAPLPQVRVRWYAFPLCNAVKNYIANNYRAANVTVYCAPGSVFYDGVMADIRSETPNFDIWIFDLNWLAEAHGANKDGLSDLSSWLISDDLNYGDFYDSALSSMEFPPGSGRYIGAPFFADVPLLAYRKSAFARYNLTLPSTLEGLVSLGEFFKQQPEYSNGTGLAFRWCTDRTAPRCRSSTINSYSANSILFSFGTSLWNSDTYKIKGVLDTPKTFDAFRFAKRIYDTGRWAGSPTLTEDSRGFVDAAYQFCNGLSPLYADFASLVSATLAYPYCRNVTSDIGFYTIPYSAANNKDGLQMAGMGLTLSPKSPESAAAKDLMKFLVSRETQLFLGKNGGSTVRKSVAADPTFAMDNNGNIMFNNIGFIQSVQRGKPMWKVHVRKGLSDLHEEYLSRALIGNMSAEDAVTALAAEQQQVLDAAFPCGPKCPIPYKRTEGLFQAMYGLAIICSVLFAAALLAVVVLRSKPVMKASSPVFLGLSIVGALMMAVSFILRFQENPSSQRCLSITWIELLGIATLFGALIAKTYRIAAIFGMKRINAVVMPDRKLFQLFGAIIVLFVGFLSAWTAIDAPYAEDVIRTLPDGNLEKEIVCTEGPFGVYSQLLQLLLLLCGSVLAFQVRNAPAAFHEAKYIAIGIYNFALVTGVLLLVQQSGAASSITFVFQGIHILGASAVIMALLLVPKFLGVYAGITEANGSSGAGVSSEVNTTSKGAPSEVSTSLKARPSLRNGSPTSKMSPRNKVASSTVAPRPPMMTSSVAEEPVPISQMSTAESPMRPNEVVLNVSTPQASDLTVNSSVRPAELDISE